MSLKIAKEKKRKKRSLTAKMLRAVIIGCIILTISAIGVGLYMYMMDLSRQYIESAVNTVHQAGMAVAYDSIPAGFARKVMRIYEDLTPEQREEVWTDQYREYFTEAVQSQEYKILKQRMINFLEYSNVSAVYLGMFDEERQAMVYIADPDTFDTPTMPGDWETVPEAAIQTFMHAYDPEKPYIIQHMEQYGWLCISAVPVYSGSGELSAFIVVEVELYDIRTGMRSFARGISVLLTIITALIAFWMIWRMRSAIVQPVNDITQAALGYMEDKKAGVKNIRRFSELDIKTGDELQELSEVMAGMERDLSAFEENLTRVTAENERIGTELDLARRIQSDMLPNIFPPFPDRSDLNIYASMDPAKEVGGDFYDFFLIDNDYLGLVMADVSGKGVPAALFMMISRILVRNYAMAGGSPREVLEKVNQQIYENNPEEMFITIWLGILDLKTGRLTASNAGHEYPILRQADGEFKVFKDKHGFVVGGMEGVKYSNYEILLEKGAKLFVYTDGVPEAEDIDGKFYGMERLVEALNQSRDRNPQEILEQVRRSVNQFAEGASQFDDITMMCLQYVGPSRPVKEIAVPAKIDSIPVVTDFVNAEMEALHVPMKIQFQMAVVIDEIFSNIAHYAFGGGHGEATVRFESSDHKIILSFIDQGISYNPLDAPEPDTTLSAEERQIGGLGIFLVRKTMDEVTYRHVDGCNILRVKKSF